MKNLLKEVESKFRAGSNHTFLFHLNVDDIFVSEEDSKPELKSLTEIISDSSPFKDARFLAFFNLATGLRFNDLLMEKDFHSFLNALDPSLIKNFIAKSANGDKLEAAIELLSILLLKPHNNRDVERALDEKDKRKNIPLIAVVFECLETIVQPQAACSSCSIDRMALVALQMWSKDLRIRRAGNAIAYIAESLNSISPQLKSDTSDIAICQVNLPDQLERTSIYRFSKTDTEPVAGDLSEEIFAKSSGGMSGKAIVSLVKECALEKRPITQAILFERKKKFIDERSGGLLKIERPLYGLNAIGDLEDHKTYINNVVKNMREGKWSLVPNGILLLGAPGTGKTVFAEAIAFEAEIPFIRMRNTRDPYVGVSERNQDFSFNIIEAHAPTLVFVDEIDQQFQMRSSIGDNTGVNQRLMSRQFEFMSDTSLRGRVLWIAASNKPHLIDPALIRDGRFDDKIPFFPSGTLGRASIVKALLYKNKVLAESRGESFEWNLSEEDIYNFARRAHCHIGKGDSGLVRRCAGEDDADHPLGLNELENDETYLTGGQIENIIRRGAEQAASRGVIFNKECLLWALLEDFIPSQDMKTYDEMTELAVAYTNSARFIPAKGRWAKVAAQRGVIRPKTDSDGPSKANFSE